MTITAPTLGLVLCLAAMPGAAQDTSLQAGRDKAGPCTTCHGLDGLRQGGDMPVIGGRDADHLLYELGRFQRAERFQPAMTLLLQNFDVADLADVATYFARMGGRDVLSEPGAEAP